MNRIILIGNGFDLAHGLKTSYTDFINDFWKNERDKVSNNLLWKPKKEYSYNYDYEGKITTEKYEDDYIYVESPYFGHSIQDQLGRHGANRDATGYAWFEEIQTINGSWESGERYSVDVKFKNTFLKHISEKSLHDWVDIELEYYRALIECLEDKIDGGIEKLNNEFSAVKVALEDYLKTQKADVPLTEIEQHIWSKPQFTDFFKQPSNFSLEKMLFLNFNYTDTAERLYSQKSIKNSEHIYLHGQLGNPDNPIIFGYSDDIGEKYKHIQDKADNKYFESIKYNCYYNTDNFSRLLRFMNLGEYQVFIMGHSCGISDKTLLNRLFEHDNCLSIKIFYRKEPDDYNDKIGNISRHFVKTGLMENKVVNKRYCVPLV